MVKNDNAHSVRLVDRLDRNAGHDTAKEFYFAILNAIVPV